MGNPFNASGSPALNEIDLGNLAMTYTALASLHLLGDGLSRLNRNGINNLIKTLQQDDGRYFIIKLAVAFVIMKMEKVTCALFIASVLSVIFKMIGVLWTQ